MLWMNLSSFFFGVLGPQKCPLLIYIEMANLQLGSHGLANMGAKMCVEQVTVKPRIEGRASRIGNHETPMLKLKVREVRPGSAPEKGKVPKTGQYFRPDNIISS